jgi:hypothetical protein
VFARNVIPGTEVAVFTRKVVKLPTVSDNSWAVAPFRFDAPFPFTGTTHLSWRAHVWGNGNNGRDFDYPLDMFGEPGATTDNGPSTGCASATGTGKAVHTASLLRPGAVSVFEARSYVASGNLPAVLGLGISSTAWGAVPLPLDLAPLGAPGCFLRNDFVLMLGGVTQPYPTGSVAIQISVPPDPGLADAAFYSQFVLLQAAANPMGLFTTNGLRNTLGRDHGVARIVFAGNPVATSGGVAPYHGLAIATAWRSASTERGGEGEPRPHALYRHPRLLAGQDDQDRLFRPSIAAEGSRSGRIASRDR